MRNSQHENDDLLDRAVEALCREPIPQEPPPDTVARTVEALQKACDGHPLSLNTIAITPKRIRNMKPISKIALAASILVAVGVVFFCMTIGGGSSGIAFAQVAEVLDNLRSATYDITFEIKQDKNKPSVTGTGKGFFLAPSHQRTECPTVFGKNATKMNSGMTTIVDGQVGKALMLMSGAKVAVAMDMKKIHEDLKKSAAGIPPDLFEMVRRLVREGNSGTGEKTEKLGKKEIDGHTVVGFRTHANDTDMIFWGDSETARPVRIELSNEMFGKTCMVMSNFRYDVDLDPSLFSLEPPPGYSTQTMNVTTPVEEDLVRTLRTIAKYSKGMFPKKLGMNKEVMKAADALFQPEMDKIAAKYGGKEKYLGKEPPPAMVAEIMKVIMPLAQKEIQQGIMFYIALKPENDAHYVGGGVKLNTPDRPILWYKPTGSEKYHVIYADLTVKEMDAEAVKKLSSTAKE